MRLLFPLLLASVLAQDQTTTTTSEDADFTLDSSITTPISDVTLPTGDYVSYSSTITLDDGGSATTSTTTSSSANASITANITSTSTSDFVTILVGGQTSIVLGNSSANATHSPTHSPTASPVVNTRPCNNYPELCARKYSNITNVAAHNSPFDKTGNVASNQEFDVISQLNDGIRMLQFQTHYTNGTMYLCHTSCELLNMGPLEDYLTDVAKWMRQHPYDVVTILIGNYDYVTPQNFSTAIENAGLKNMIYTPSKIPMALDDWPTLSEMIITGKRAVIFMDYQANQTAIPWLMDEFSQIWETPFSPTDVQFPCTVQRPPGLNDKDAENRMYMANHNLNIEFNFGTLSLLIPNTALLSQTNGVSGNGSLGRMSEDCTQKWNRAPNFLLVDYYNYGNFNGSVFEVAANANGLNYTGNCCGTTSTASIIPGQNMISILALAAGVHLIASLF